MKFEILKGRKSLNDWFCLELSVNNFISFELSFLGYGIFIEISIYNSLNELNKGENKNEN